MKRVSVLVVNMRGLYSMRRDDGATKMMAAHKQLIEVVTAHVRANKGFIDGFSGDHVVCSFNAVNNIVACNRRAAAALVATLRDLPTKGIKATAGMATGLSLVGNMGSDDMKRFCIIGDALTSAMQLERLSKAYDVDHLTQGSGMLDINTHYSHEALDIVKLGKSGGKPTLEVVVAIREREQGEMQEWMYELQDSEKGDGNKAVNAAFEALQRGNREAASAHLQTLKTALAQEGDNAKTTTPPRGMANLERLLAQTSDGIPHTDLGIYYDLL